MTNREYLSTLSDEDLAEYFTDCDYISATHCAKYGDGLTLCRQCIADWLKEEYKDD